MKTDLQRFLVQSGLSLRQVMQKIDHNGYGVALVVNSEGILLGIVTDGDIRRAILRGTALDIPISKVMNPLFATLPEQYTPAHVAEHMNEKLYRHIPVVDEKGKVTELLVTDEIQGIMRQHIKHNTLQNTSSLFSPKELTKGKHILVVGGGGYIGSVVVRQLLEKGYAVKILDKLIFGKNSLPYLGQQKQCTLVLGDTGNLETVITAVKDVDAVIHLAEIVGDPACALDPEKTQQMNYLSTVLIAQVCKHFQINRFVYTSSCSVYGAGEETALLTESSPLNPVSLYARMKEESERALLSMADGFFSPTILRLATVFGLSPRMRFDLVINTLTLKAVREKKITVFGGDQWRPNVHVSDVAKAIIATLEAPISLVSGEIFNLGSNENNFTIHQLGEMVQKAVPSTSFVQIDKAIDKRNYRVEFSKISRVLGFTPQVSVQRGIQEIASALEAGKYPDHNQAIYYNDKWYGQQKEN